MSKHTRCFICRISSSLAAWSFDQPISRLSVQRLYNSRKITGIFLINRINALFYITYSTLSYLVNELTAIRFFKFSSILHELKICRELFREICAVSCLTKGLVTLGRHPESHCGKCVKLL